MVSVSGAVGFAALVMNGFIAEHLILKSVLKDAKIRT